MGTPSSRTFTQAAVQSSSARFLMTDEEIDLIFNAATDCAESECSIDEVENLIGTLRTQEGQLKTRLALISSMIEKLSHVNEKDGRDIDEVRQYVRDFLRVFTNEKSGFDPTGFLEMSEAVQQLRMMHFHLNHGKQPHRRHLVTCIDENKGYIELYINYKKCIDQILRINFKMLQQ